ncbi:MAG: hypothetical protein RL017_395 [Pseudomonadota bacterium]|jgi:hypothetical protein
MKNLINMVLFALMAIFTKFAVASGGSYAIFPTTSSDNSVNFIECQFAQITSIDYIPYYQNCFQEGINSVHSGPPVSGTVAAVTNKFDVYFVNYGTNNFSICQLDAYGSVLNGYCRAITPSGAGAIQMPADMQISGNYAYIIGKSPQLQMRAITQCRYNFLAGVEVSSCVTSSLKFAAEHILVNNNVAYIYAGVTVNQCNVTSNGIDLSSCQQSTITSGSENLTGADVYNGSIYFVASPSNIIICNLTASNNINTSSCHDYPQADEENNYLFYFSGAKIFQANGSIPNGAMLLTGNAGEHTFNLCFLTSIAVSNKACFSQDAMYDGSWLPYHGWGAAINSK